MMLDIMTSACNILLALPIRQLKNFVNQNLLLVIIGIGVLATGVFGLTLWLAFRTGESDDSETEEKPKKPKKEKKPKPPKKEKPKKVKKPKPPKPPKKEKPKKVKKPKPPKKEKPKKVKKAKPPKPPKKAKTKKVKQPATVQAAEAESMVEEDYKLITSRIVGARSKTFLLAAAGPDCLPITVPVNVAIQLAEEGNKTLLIDLDLKRDAIAKAFNIPDMIPPDFRPKAYKTEAFGNLRIWPAHHFINLKHMIIRPLAQAAETKYDYVIINAPYLDGSPDKNQIAAAASCGLIFTKTAPQIKRLTKILKHAGCKLIGNLTITKPQAPAADEVDEDTVDNTNDADDITQAENIEIDNTDETKEVENTDIDNIDNVDNVDINDMNLDDLDDIDIDDIDLSEDDFDDIDLDDEQDPSPTDPDLK